MTTTFKDDALEVAVILHWMKRAFVYFSKVWDKESEKKINIGFEFNNGIYCT
jgi:hypothetical protein